MDDSEEFFGKQLLLAQPFGDKRVFNTPIQEAFIIGSTVGMSAVGCKPIVEVQFADYIWPGLNQFITEVCEIQLFVEWQMAGECHHPCSNW
ncbi:MAG: hypothetical protein IPP64_05290 [Bacteroidetes bacterium]|nr:hypothetical protein [Bacteroidota bacterium]